MPLARSAAEASRALVAPAAGVTTSWGWLAVASRLLWWLLLELVVVRARLRGPLPVTALVTSSSTQVLAVVAPAVAIGVPVTAGALACVSPVSVQVSATLKTLPPSGLGSVT